MATIERYVLVGRDGYEQDHEFDSYDDAIEAAGDDKAVIERHYEYTDSELVWTPDDTAEWPSESQYESQ